MQQQMPGALRRACRVRAGARRAESIRLLLWRVDEEPLRRREEFARGAAKDRSQSPWPCRAIEKIRDQARRAACERQRLSLREIRRPVSAIQEKILVSP